MNYPLIILLSRGKCGFNGCIKVVEVIELCIYKVGGAMRMGGMAGAKGTAKTRIG